MNQQPWLDQRTKMATQPLFLSLDDCCWLSNSNFECDHCLRVQLQHLALSPSKSFAYKKNKSEKANRDHQLNRTLSLHVHYTLVFNFSITVKSPASSNPCIRDAKIQVNTKVLKCDQLLPKFSNFHEFPFLFLDDYFLVAATSFMALVLPLVIFNCVGDFSF